MKLFIKFGETEYLKRCKELGLFYFSTAERYKEIEFKEKIKGQGDNREATVSIRQTIKATFTDQMGRKITLNNANLDILIGSAANIPVYCITQIDTDVDCVHTKDGYSLSPEFIKGMRTHFPKADAALIFDSSIDLAKVFEANFSNIIHRNVDYFQMPQDGLAGIVVPQPFVLSLNL